MRLPTHEAGVGIIYTPGLEPIIDACGDLISVLEIEPQIFWKRSQSDPPEYEIDPAFLERMDHFPHKKIVHSVGFPVGGSCHAAKEQLPAFLDTIDVLDAAWASEHLSFNRASDGEREFNAGFLLAPLQTEDTVRQAASNIQSIQSQISIPFAFETGVNYLRPRPEEMPDGEFFTAVANAADCNILLDLHNLWANERNGRQSVADTLAQLPLDRVLEVHLAGGEMLNNYWLDAHSDLAPPELLAIAETIISQLPNLKAIIFEIMEDYVTAKNIQTDQFVKQFERLNALWNMRKSNIADHKSEKTQTTYRNVTTSINPSDWERNLALLATNLKNNHVEITDLNQDPGIDIYRELITSVRGGMVVSTLRLTYRLLALNIGQDGFLGIMTDFWHEIPPEQFVSHEVANFAEYLRKIELDIPYLYDVLSYEIASLEVLQSGGTRTVSFNCDPLPFLSALKAGHLPDNVTEGQFEITVEE